MHEGMAADGLDRRGVSAREREVLVAVADHRSNAEIAALLGLSERTVESHVSSLLRKLGVASCRHLEPFARRESAAVGVERPALPLPLQRLCEDGPWFGRDAELAGLLTQWEADSTRAWCSSGGRLGSGSRAWSRSSLLRSTVAVARLRWERVSTARSARLSPSWRA